MAPRWRPPSARDSLAGTERWPEVAPLRVPRRRNLPARWTASTVPLEVPRRGGSPEWSVSTRALRARAGREETSSLRLASCASSTGRWPNCLFVVFQNPKSVPTENPSFKRKKCLTECVSVGSFDQSEAYTTNFSSNYRYLDIPPPFSLP